MNKLIKLSSMLMLIATLALTFPSCDRSNSETNTEKDADKRNEANLPNAMENDAKYVVDAYADGMMEIRMAERVQGRLLTDDAKHVAEMMIKEHTALNNEMRALAEQKQISLPTELTKNQQDDIDDCAKKTGIDLDKKYLDKTVSMHRNAIDLFEKANDKVNDADVRNAFATALPKLRNHLDMAVTARDLVDNMNANTKGATKTNEPNVGGRR